jgi:hypothetical protein
VGDLGAAEAKKPTGWQALGNFGGSYPTRAGITILLLPPTQWLYMMAPLYRFVVDVNNFFSAVFVAIFNVAVL